MLTFEHLSKGPFFFAGPCVIENMELLHEVGQKLKDIQEKYPEITLVFKASFDKANRTSLQSFRGPGVEKGLAMLAEVKAIYGLPIITDIHEAWQAAPAADVVDVIQIPAFLCRQTDLLVAAAKTGKIVNVKKAQFLSALDMKYPFQKIADSGNNQVILTERGNMFGYNNLVVDFRNIADMKEFGVPVCMDCTHSVQRPGGLGGKSGGDRKFVPNMAKAAKVFGADGYFLEVHPNPDQGLSDGPNMLPLEQLEPLIEELISR